MGGGGLSFLVLPGLCERLSSGAQAETKGVQCRYGAGARAGMTRAERWAEKMGFPLELSLPARLRALPACQQLRGPGPVSWRAEALAFTLAFRISGDLGPLGLLGLGVPVAQGVHLRVSLAVVKHQDVEQWRASGLADNSQVVTLCC